MREAKICGINVCGLGGLVILVPHLVLDVVRLSTVLGARL